MGVVRCGWIHYVAKVGVFETYNRIFEGHEYPISFREGPTQLGHYKDFQYEFVYPIEKPTH